MQDRYAGDIGDYGKFGMLQALSAEGFQIGVNWYRTEPRQNESKQNDGGILIPDKYSVCNKQLYWVLCDIARSSDRTVSALEQAVLIPGAVYYSCPVSMKKREEWHEKAMMKLAKANLVFLDPDNGFIAKSVGRKSERSSKYVFYEEVADYLNSGKSVVVYNHRSRKRAETYFGEIYDALTKVISSNLTILAITFPKGTVRDYFAVSANPEHINKIENAFHNLCFGKWGELGLCRLQPVPYLQCKNCGNDRLLPILYGMPTSAAFDLENKGCLHIGGCCIEEHAPMWFCPKCQTDVYS